MPPERPCEGLGSSLYFPWLFVQACQDPASGEVRRAIGHVPARSLCGWIALCGDQRVVAPIRGSFVSIGFNAIESQASDDTDQADWGRRAMTLISKSKPASQFTPIAVQFG